MDEQAITIRLPKELYRRLRRVAFDREVSMNAIVTEAVTTALDAEARMAALDAQSDETHN